MIADNKKDGMMVGISRVKTKTQGGNKITSTINGVETVVEGGLVNRLVVENNAYQVGKRDIRTAYNSSKSRKWQATDATNPDKVFCSYFEIIAIIKCSLGWGAK